MNILFLTHQFVPRHIGGTELYTLGLARQLQAGGASVEVVTYVESASADPADFRPTHIEQAGLPVTEIPYNLSVSRFPAFYEFANPVIARRIEGVIDRFRPDLVHATHLMKLSGAALRPAFDRRLPVVVTLTDFWAVCGRHTLLRSNGRLCRGPRHGFDCVPCLRATHGFTRARFWPGVHLLSRTLAVRAVRTGTLWPLDVLADVAAFPLRLPYLRGILRRASRVVVLSDFQRRLLTANGLDQANLEVVPHGLEALPQARWSRPPEARFAYVGSLAPHKGLQVVVDALQEDPSLGVELDVYGEGPAGDPYAESLRARSASDPRIHWKGRLEPSDLASVVARYTGLVVPSLWYENNPLIVQLAVALGVPVLASRLGTLEELLALRQGHVLVPAGVAAAWAQALRLVASGELPPPQSAGDLPTWESHARRIQEIYAEVLA